MNTIFYRFKIDTIPWEKQYIFQLETKNVIEIFTVNEAHNLLFYVDSNSIYAVNNNYNVDEDIKSKHSVLILNDIVESIEDLVASERYLYFINGDKIERCNFDGSERVDVLREEG